ncbi:MAG: ribosome small subunit-dependent GTPase A [Acidobacteriaceae bacterium]|nr:ribosome small subunit-dependent GTPase A [Acidobacteriaceae bacterium]
MGREERKWKKHLQQREQNERRKLAKLNQKSKFSPAAERGEHELIQGEVIRTGPLTIRLAERDVTCRPSVDCAIGDRVMFSPERQRVMRVLPRSSILSRPDPHNPRIQLILASNIDIVVNVVSVQSPPLSPGLIDRFLIAIAESGAAPLICVNKVDLGMPHHELQPYLTLGIPFVFCSAATGEGVEDLRTALTARTCVFTGHSGVGKSSLLNALDSELGLATGAVSDSNRKGRHTTTSSRLYELSNGVRVIDTPGIRELGLWNVTAAELHRYFREFNEFALECAFRDCSHSHEPRCAVKTAVDRGAIAQARYEAYLRIKISACEPGAAL